MSIRWFAAAVLLLPASAFACGMYVPNQATLASAFDSVDQTPVVQVPVAEALADVDVVALSKQNQKTKRAVEQNVLFAAKFAADESMGDAVAARD